MAGAFGWGTLVTVHASEGSGGWYAQRVRRYLLAGIGPVTLAGTHFAISFALLRLDAPAAFGIFTFLFVAAQFTVALSAALFGAPLQALPASRAGDDHDDAAAAIITASAAMAVVTGIAFVALSFAMGLWGRASLFYGAYTATMILRWVGRSWCYAQDRPLRAVASDVIYGVVTLAVFGFTTYVRDGVPEGAAYAALAAGSALSLAAFGRGYARLLAARSTRRARAAYRAIWRDQSRWALLGVVTMEAVANAHVYLVTLVAGAEAMAPLAAAALMLRPINVVQNALVDFERPQMARLIADRALAELRRTIRLFLAVLWLVWGAASALALGIVWFAPWLVLSPDYDLSVIRVASVCWVGVAMLVLLQIPASVMLQAAGDFRPLANTTIRSSVVSVVAVGTTLALFDPEWTIAALALGWLTDLILIRRAAARRWRLLDSAAGERL